jgi:hypothetical protein
MVHRYVAALIFTICAFTTSLGQTNHPQGARKTYVTVPSENILLLTAAQPSAPVRFEEARIVMSSDGKEFEIIFDIHNVGTKPIRRLTPVMWTSFGTGGTLRPQPINGMLQPGEVESNRTRQVVALSPEVRERLKGPMRALIVLLVEDVTFADGSTYSDLSTSKALLSYFEDVSDKIERLQNIDRANAKRMLR